ncbi:MFS transporter [Burkholderia sp. KK1]|uniref:Major facilitator transporter n=1 Tax=Caballeronia cordobensis TaxID=1353886 RepID=A0A158IAU0_CABCO|nr:MFS transporter [Caballeronia cordobensis]AQH03310.1 MFS transporter [Burkholderia sp. KK1]SAL53698.1 major facilitator transporter [Caballeronia cordobensis]
MDRRLITLALGMFALGTDSFVFAGILPEIADSFGVSIGAAGQLISVYALSYALLGPTIAALAANVGRKRLLLSGIGLFVIANLGTIVAPNLGIALATRALAGLGAAMFSPTASGTAAALVPPERRGYALSIIVAGLTTATALGSPIGAVIGGFAGWHWTLVLVAALGAAAFFGILAFMPDVPLPPAISLRARLSPLTDARVGLTLTTTVLAQIGTFIIFSYFSVVFDRATGHSPVVLGALLVLWGLAGTFSNLLTGRILDRIGSHRVVMIKLAIVAAVVFTLPITSAHLWSAAIAVTIWGACAWGVLVPQQFRLASLNPPMTAVLVGLNTSATYVGVSIAGTLGAAVIPLTGSHNLGYLAAVPVAIAILVSALATRRIASFAGSKSAVAA